MSEQRSAGVPVTLRLTDIGHQRPEMLRLECELVVRNQSPRPRWLVVPDVLPHATVFAVDEVAAFRLEGRVPALHCGGPAGCFALLVPPGGALRATDLPLSWWGDLPETFTVEVALADSIVIEGREPAGWLDLELAVEEPSDAAPIVVNARALRDKREALALKHAEGYAPLDFELSDAESYQLQIVTT